MNTQLLEYKLTRTESFIVDQFRSLREHSAMHIHVFNDKNKSKVVMEKSFIIENEISRTRVERNF